jgi:hypothetical protein
LYKISSNKVVFVLSCHTIYLMSINQSMQDHDVLLRLANLSPTTGDPDMIGWLTGLAGLVAWMMQAARRKTRRRRRMECEGADPNPGPGLPERREADSHACAGQRLWCRPAYGRLQGLDKNQCLYFSDLRLNSWTSV